MNKRVLALLCAVFMTLAVTVGILPFSAAAETGLTEQRLVMTPDGGIVKPEAPVKTRNTKSSTPMRGAKGASPVQVVLEGALPEDISAETVNVDPMQYIMPTGNDILCAYDISLYSDEQEYEPEDTEIRVSVSGSMIADAADGSLVVVHIQDDPAAPMELIEDFTLSGDTLTFSTDHFSVFLIVDVDEEGTETIKQARECYFFLGAGTDNQDGTYTAPLYPIETDEPGDPGRDPVWNQIVKKNDCLNEVPIPPANEDGKSFLGWYYVEVEGDVPDPEHVTGTETFTYRWPSDDELCRAEFGTPIETIHVDAQHPDRMVCYFLAPLYRNYRILVFHDYKAEGSTEETLVTRKLVVLGDNAGTLSADALISDVSGSYISDNNLFTGWDRTPNNDPNNPGSADYPTIGANGQALETKLHITETEFPETEIHLYPHYEAAHWLTFDKKKSNATYIHPILVRPTDKFTREFFANSIPSLEGFEFEGWYADEACQTDRVTDNNGEPQGQWVNFPGSRMTGSMKLYARWRSISAIKYKVIYWTQRADANNHPDTPEVERTYDYYDYVEKSGYYQSEQPAINPPAHYHYGWTDGPKLLDEDGNTVINVYYDRDIRNIVFQRYGTPGSTAYYVDDSATNSPQKYGLVNGEFVPLTYESVIVDKYTPKYTYSKATSGSLQNKRTYYRVQDGEYVEVELYYSNGTFYTDRTWVWDWFSSHYEGVNPVNYDVYDRVDGGSAYTGTRYKKSGDTFEPTEETGNGLYMLDENRAYVLLNYSQDPVWKWYDPDHNVYTGQRYKTGTANGWYVMQTFTGLYGQSFMDAGYEWPSEYKWYLVRNPGNGDRRQTLKTEFVDGNTTENGVTNYYSTEGVGSSNKRIHHMLEPIPPSDENAEWIEAATAIGLSNTYVLTDDEGPNNKFASQGFVISEYKADNAARWTTYNGQEDVTYSTNLWIRYKRVTSTFNYMKEDGVTVLRSVQIPVGAKISDYTSSDVPYTYEDPEKEFREWCIDRAGVNAFDFDSAMPYVPEGSYNVYPGYVVPEYPVVIYPNGGDFGQMNYSTFFNVTPAEYISEYTAVTKQFKPDSAGEYYYIYTFKDDERPLVDPDHPEVRLDRVAKYVRIDSDEARAYRNFIDTSQRYAPMEPKDGSYVLDGWYQFKAEELAGLDLNDPDTFKNREPFNFGESAGTIISNSFNEDDTDKTIILVAKWSPIGARYRLIYSEADENGIGGTLPDGIYDPPKPATVTPRDYYRNYGYLEENTVVLAGAPQNITAGYVFEYWEIGDERYGPGDTITILRRMADDDLNIKVKAVFAKREESIHNQKLTNLWLHMNDGADPEMIRKLNFLQQNEVVNLSAYREEFQRESFELLGWSTDPNASVPEFDVYDRVGADLRDPENPDGTMKTNHLYAVWLPHPAPTMYHDNAVPFGVLVISAGAAVVLIILIRRRKEVVVHDDASL